VAFNGRAREVRDLGVRDRDRVGEALGEAAKAGAEVDGYFWLERGTLTDEGGGAFGFGEGRSVSDAGMSQDILLFQPPPTER